MFELKILDANVHIIEIINLTSMCELFLPVAIY